MAWLSHWVTPSMLSFAVDMNLSRQRKLQVGMLVGTITALVVYEIAQMLFESTQPGYYYEYRGFRSLEHEFRFPYVGVSVSVGLLILEAGAVGFVLTRKSGWLWLRGMCCLGVLLPAAWFGILSAMHSPPYYAVHVQWLAFITTFVMVVVLASVASNLYQRLRDG